MRLAARICPDPLESLLVSYEATVLHFWFNIKY